MSEIGERPLVVYTTNHPWIETVVEEVRPPEFDVAFVDRNDAARVGEIFPNADFLVCLGLTTDEARLLQRCKLVMHNGVGYDAIDVATLGDMGIPVAVTPAMTPEGVAEHVFMLVLGLCKQLPAVQESMRSGEWNMFGWREGSHNLAYKTFGIVGLGRIGARVAHLAHAFGCRVLFADVEEKSADLIGRYDLTHVPLDDLLAQSDVVTMHVPLTAATENMIGAAQLAQMPKGAFFINAARGPVCDLEALCDAVESGHLGGAGVDVFNPEPLPSDHRIRNMRNVICTPHIASGTVERQYAINRAQFENCRRVLAGEQANDLL